jgi:glutamine synthetase
MDPDFPDDWGVAIERLQRSELLNEYLGEKYLAAYCEAKRLERRAYLKEMPKEEFDWYL